jgi:O-antigen ligase
MRKTALTCVYLTAILFWTNRFVPLILLSIAALIGSGEFARLFMRIRLVSSRAVLPFSIFLIYVLFTAPVSLILDPVDISGRVVVTPIVAFTAFAYIRPTREEIGRIIMLLAVACAVVSILMYVQTGPYQVNLNLASVLIRYRGDGYWLLGSFYPGASLIGGPGAIAVVGAFYGGLKCEQRLTRLFFFALVSIATLILILSVSRGALVASFAGVFLLAVFNLPVRRIIAFGLISVVLVALFVGTAIDYIPNASNRYGSMFSSSDRSMSGRYEFWASYAKIALHHPWGSGFNYRDQYTAHNEIIGQWVASGILGAIAYLFLIGYWGVMSLRYAESLAMFTLFAGIGMAEHFTVSSGSLIFPLFWIIFAAFVMQARQKKSNFHEFDVVQSVV